MKITGYPPGDAGAQKMQESFPSPRDAVLSAIVRETLASHVRLSHVPVEMSIRGGVAHVRGVVPLAEDRRLLRRVLARIGGIHAVWDLLAPAEDEQLRVIDLGCGSKKQVPCATGVDRYPFEGVDIVTDLEGTLPFADCEIDHVFAVHVLEHIRDLLAVMNEIHRILKPDGVLHVMTPHSRCVNAAADPTHVRFFNRQTFKFFCRSYPGLRPFRPGSVSGDRDNVYADLSPVQPGEALPSPEELAYFFD